MRSVCGERALVDLQHQVDVRRVRAQLLERLEQRRQPRPLELHRVGVDEQLRRVRPVLHELDRLAPEQAAQLGLYLRSDRLGEVEQLDRALRQVREAAAAERLAGRDLAARQRDHGLEAPS